MSRKTKTLVFIDESGDSGRDGKRFFILAAVIIDGATNAKNIDDAIKNLSVRLARREEFKFYECRNYVRDAFFDAMRGQPFRVQAVIIDKQRIHDHTLLAKPRKFYNYFLKELIKQSAVRGAVIRLDGEGNREFVRALKSYIDNESPLSISEFAMKDSKKDRLVQLADMMAGAIARSCYPEVKNYRKWRDMIGRYKLKIYEWK